jgi:hypothetical protein
MLSRCRLRCRREPRERFGGGFQAPRWQIHPPGSGKIEAVEISAPKCGFSSRGCRDADRRWLPLCGAAVARASGHAVAPRRILWRDVRRPDVCAHRPGRFPGFGAVSGDAHDGGFGRAGCLCLVSTAQAALAPRACRGGGDARCIGSSRRTAGGQRHHRGK